MRTTKRIEMNFFLKIKLIILACFLFSNLNGQQMYQPTWESLSNYKCPDWFRDAKFGIFIHWGVYSVPGFGSEWYPRQMYDRNDTTVFNHHVRTYGTQDKFGYKDFIPMFRAEKFNADEWVDLFKRSGAKYIVPVAEHHDGFAMYKTGLSKWNAFNMGPRRDIIGELAEAARKQGLIFGLSSHRIEHWFFMSEGMKFPSDVRDPAYFDFYGPARNQNDTSMSVEHMNDWLLRCCELVDKYQPQLFWFDWYIEQSCLEPYRRTFAAYYYNHALQWNKEVVINFKNRAYPDNVAVYDIERGSSRATRKYPWQTDTSVGKKSWGWISDEENKTPDEIIDALIDIVSKNGNLLLNIGPKPDGTISPGQAKVLLRIGEWLKINGEGIYGTRPWIISGEGPTVAAEGSFGDIKSPVYTAEDIRFTSKGNIVYAFCLDVPSAQKITIKSLGTGTGSLVKIKNIELLGSTEKIKWSQKKDKLLIDTPKSIQFREALAFKVTY